MPLQAENGALQGLVVDMAANKAEAQQRLADLKEKYQHLLQVMWHAPGGAHPALILTQSLLSWQTQIHLSWKLFTELSLEDA